MLDVPVDTWYVWLGCGLVSVAVAGLGLSLPTAAPPSATPVADAVDSVASSPHEARTTVELSTDEIRLRPGTVALRSEGGTTHASFAFGPVTPASTGRLGRILDGERPADVFESREAFRRAIRDRQNRTATWQPAPDQLTVARVEWGDVNATLVG